MKYDIKQFSYLQMNEKLKKKYKIYLLKTEKDKTGSPVFLWFFGNLCNSAPLKFLWKAAYVSRTG